MKPMGMTSDFKMIRSTSAEDKIWDAVEAALCASPRMTVKQFINEAAQAWDWHLKDEGKSASVEFEKGRK